MKYFKKTITIANVEYAALRSALPSLSKRGIGFLFVYAVFALAVFIYIFHDKMKEPIHLMVGLTSFILSVSYMISFFSMLQFASTPYRDWWLTLPYPRHVIVYAKLISTLRSIMSVSVGPIIIAGIVLYVIAVDRWGMQSIPFEEFIAVGAGLMILFIVSVPIAITLGQLVTTLYSGWVRWVYIVPYFVLIAISFSAMILVQMIDVQYLSGSHLLVYALIGLIVGWPLMFLLLRYIARVGMNNMANINSSSDKKASIMSKQNTKKTAIHINNKKRRFSVLYQWERSRYTYISSLLPIRIFLYVTALIIGFIAYISAMKIGSMNVLGFVAFLISLPLILPVFWSMMINMTDAQKNRLDMWLCFPYARIQLVMARIAAIWMTAMRFVVTMSVVFWGATLAAIVIHSGGTEQLQLSLVWFAYGLTLYVSTLTISMAVLQILGYTSKLNRLGILFAPLYFFVFYQTTILLNHFMPEELGNVAVYPHWTRLIMLIVIGLPLGLVSVRLGAQHLHCFLRQATPIIPRTKK